jgi:predicted Fe-S protein YdhL (DUF1289 family)
MNTPCINVCEIDPKLKRCRGCWRTLEQIESWIEYSPDKQLELMEELEIAQWETGHKSWNSL